MDSISKQKPKRFIRVGVGMFLMLAAVSVVYAQTVDEIRDSISGKQGELNQITTEIQNLQRQITRKQSEVASLRNEIELFDLQIKQTEAQIQGVELEINILSYQILETRKAIEEKNEALIKQKEFLAETLRLINEYDSVSSLEITFGNDTFSQFLDQVQYATNLQEEIQVILEEIRRLRAELEQKKVELEKQLVSQEELRGQLLTAKQSLEAQQAEKQSLLAATRGQERIYQTLLADAARKQEEVSREIFELEVEVRQKLGDKTLPPIKGVLRWPMSGILTQGYGKTGFTALGYNFHNGLDIAAPAGTKIYAAGDGIVHAVGRGQAAYGNWVLIKHTISKDAKVFNIFTLYAHMQSIAATTGQAVRGGDLIGYEGNTGNTTRLLYGPERGYHVHFTIFDEEGFKINPGAYQDLYGPYEIPIGYTYNPLDFLE